MIIIDRIIEKGHHNHPKGVFLMKKFALLALLGAAAAGAAAEIGRASCRERV